MTDQRRNTGLRATETPSADNTPRVTPSPDTLDRANCPCTCPVPPPNGSSAWCHRHGASATEPCDEHGRAVTPSPDTLDYEASWYEKGYRAARAVVESADAHKPGEAHRYGPLICEVCGVRGQVRVSLVPEYAAPPTPPLPSAPSPPVSGEAPR